ncbi:MAG: hypothetical protein V8Q42_00315 [Anaerovoracaceae bacterium]
MIRDRRVSRDLGENVANRGFRAIKANLEKKANKVFRDPRMKKGKRRWSLLQTPMSYKLNFKTTGQDVTAPNLFTPYSEYHAALSTTGSMLSIPLKSRVLTYQ